MILVTTHLGERNRTTYPHGETSVCDADWCYILDKDGLTIGCHPTCIVESVRIFTDTSPDTKAGELAMENAGPEHRE
jgi:hypothetical protein